MRSRFSANDSQILQSAACRGLGIAMVARYIARPEIEAGRLKTLLPDYPVPELWLKALIPTSKTRRAAVQSLLALDQAAHAAAAAVGGVRRRYATRPLPTKRAHTSVAYSLRTARIA